MKIHILGPSGSGTSTVGKLLAEKLSIPFFESDYFFWEKTEVPFSRVRPSEVRTSILNEMIQTNPSWILSGSAMNWGDILLRESDLIVLLYTDCRERLKRIKKRESERFGDRIKPGNDMHRNHKAFIQWAMDYDKGGLEMRSRVSLEAWVKKAKCKVLYLNNKESDEIAGIIISTLSD